MDPSEPGTKQRGLKKKTETQPLGIKKKQLKAGKDTANGGDKVKAKLEAMKKFSHVMVKPRGDSSSSDVGINNPSSTSSSIENKSNNKYAEEVLKDAIKKRINDKFQLSKVLSKTNQSKPLIEPQKKKLESSDVTDSQLEGLIKKFNQKIYISIGERASLASELGLTEYQVQVWFANRRTKLKKTKELSDLKTSSTSKAVKQLEAPSLKKAKGGPFPKLFESQPKTKAFQVDALSKMIDIEKKMKNPEVIDIIDDEDDLSGNAFSAQVPKEDDVPTVTNQAKATRKLKLERQKRQEGIDEDLEEQSIQAKQNQVDKCLDPKGDKVSGEGKDREVEILKQEIKIILNDMVKKSVMEKEIEAWGLKYDSVMKAYKEKEQVVKNLEVKIPNMIEEFTKCVENKEYLFDLKEKELKKNETFLIEKDNKLKSYQSEIVKLNNELDQWKKEKNDFVMKVANMDVKASKLSNEVFKKDMEIKKFKEKERESASKIKQLVQDLDVKKVEHLAQNQTNSELSILKANAENQANSIANLTKTCDYQKSQISYFRKEIETKVELINKKETELKQIKENVSNLAAIQTNVSQLMLKSENQNKIIENQKTIITKYKVQTDEQSKQISKLAELQEKVNENNDLGNTLKQSLEKKSNQVKNLKKSIEVKNTEMNKFKSAQDQLFSQINDLELKNFNKSEELKTVEAKYEKVKTLDKKSVKTISIYEAAREYMVIMKESQKQKKVTEKFVKKDVQIITLDELNEVEAELVESAKIIRNDSNEMKDRMQSEAVDKIIAVETLPKTDNYSPLKFNFGEEAVPYVMVQSNESIPNVAMEMTKDPVGEKKETILKASHQPVAMITYLWPLVSTQSEQNASSKEIKFTSNSVGKLTRKLVKRPDIDMAASRGKQRFLGKRSLVTDSGIPTKRMRLFSRIYKYDNHLKMSQTLWLPFPLQLNSWEKLLKMKLILSSSVFSTPDLKFSLTYTSHPLPPSLPPLGIGYNWPIVPYTAVSRPVVHNIKPAEPSFVDCQKLPLVVDRFDLLFPPSSLFVPLLPDQSVSVLHKCKVRVKRPSCVHIHGESAKRLKFDSPVWPLVLYRSCAVLGKTDARFPAIRSFDLLYPRGNLSDTQGMMPRKKRSRSVDEPEETSKSKKFKLSSISPCWPVAIIHPTAKIPNSILSPLVPQVPSVTLHFTLPSTDLTLHLPTPPVNWPLLPFKNFNLEFLVKAIPISPQPSQHISFPEVSGVKLLFSPISLMCLHQAPATTCWPLVPYKSAQPVTGLKKRLRTLAGTEPPAKKMKLDSEARMLPSDNDVLCKQARMYLSDNDDMCKQLVISLLESVPASTVSSSHKNKKFRISLQNRPKSNKIFS